jgi:Fur family ferric uptake transcriptional regulator
MAAQATAALRLSGPAPVALGAAAGVDRAAALRYGVATELAMRRIPPTAPRPSRRRSLRSAGVADRVVAISARLKQRGFKRSAVREAVVEEFLRAGTHLSIEQLLERVRARAPGIGYSTVYRTLRLLAENGYAAARDFGGAQALYEPADTRHHDHVVCVVCGRVAEFEDRAIEELQEQVARRLGFQITSHRLELYGRCSACAARDSGRRKRAAR